MGVVSKTLHDPRGNLFPVAGVSIVELTIPEENHVQT